MKTDAANFDTERHISINLEEGYESQKAPPRRARKQAAPLENDHQRKPSKTTMTFQHRASARSTLRSLGCLPACVGACISPTLGNNTNCTGVLWDVVPARHVFFWSVVASARPLGVRCRCGLDHKLYDRNWLAHHSRVETDHCFSYLIAIRVTSRRPSWMEIKEGYNCHCTPSEDAARLHALAVQLL